MQVAVYLGGSVGVSVVRQLSGSWADGGQSSNDLGNVDSSVGCCVVGGESRAGESQEGDC